VSFHFRWVIVVTDETLFHAVCVLAIVIAILIAKLANLIQPVWPSTEDCYPEYGSEFSSTRWNSSRSFSEGEP